MKAHQFSYSRPRSLDEALSLLSEHREVAKIIAGGQSLVPALNLRLLAPAILIDIGRIEALKGIVLSDDKIGIGGLVRHVDLERSPDIDRHAPLIAAAVRHVAHPAIRNRGTIGGSLANADPASELPACMLALDAVLILRSSTGERRIRANEFFRGFYETALAPDEIIVSIDVPVWRDHQRFAFRELARRTGDYAMAGLAAVAVVEDGACQCLRVAFFGVGETPVLAHHAAEALTGGRPDAASLDRAVGALKEDLDPQNDLQASAPMRLHLAGVLLRRAAAGLFPESDFAAASQALA